MIAVVYLYCVYWCQNNIVSAVYSIEFKSDHIVYLYNIIYHYSIGCGEEGSPDHQFIIAYGFYFDFRLLRHFTTLVYQYYFTIRIYYSRGPSQRNI